MAKKNKFYALVEFPYPSGSGLHIGHAFTFSIMDVLARKKRMQGFDVLYPMGWDAFGLPTENYAIKTGIHPAKATKKNISCFKQQMKKMGLAYDWEREVNTTDPEYYHWTQWIFIQLFKHGLAYKKKMPINWCPSCKIGLANEEVLPAGRQGRGKCERCGAVVGRKELTQWLLRITAYADRLAGELDLVDFPEYVKAAQRNWIGRKEWIDISYPLKGTKKAIICSTTRPDTNFGATFIVLAPEHPIVAELLAPTPGESSSNTPGEVAIAESLPGGDWNASQRLVVPWTRLPRGGAKREVGRQKKIKAYVEQAKAKSELERMAEARAKTGVFTGLYAINQLNNKKIPVWIADFVLMNVGTGAVVGVPAHDQRDLEFAKKFKLPIIKVVEQGRMINSEFLNGMKVDQAIKTMIDYIEKKGWGKRIIRYHLRDWIFSRQHYWGEPIPMVKCKKCGWVPLSESELPLKLPKVEKYKPTTTGKSPLEDMKDWVNTKCPHCQGPARRETDTMPNWAGSSWYYLAYTMSSHSGRARFGHSRRETTADNIFLQNKEALEHCLPVDLYLGGAEHTTLHLLYSRFWHKFLNDIGVVPGKEPYQARRQHGVILGEDGYRMSKSRGNVINPEDIIKKYGADTLRLYLLFMGPYDQTMSWNSKGVVGCHRFLKKVRKMCSLNAASTPGESSSNTPGESASRRSHSPGVTGTPARGWSSPGRGSPGVGRSLHRLIKKVSEDIDQFKHNTAIAAMMKFVKQISLPAGGELSIREKEVFLKLLAPFAPFMAEELLPGVHQQKWPQYEPKLAGERVVTIIVQINGKMRGKLKVPAKGRSSEARPARGGKNHQPEADRPLDEKAEIEKMARANQKVQKHLQNKKVRKIIFVSGRLINFVVN